MKRIILAVAMLASLSACATDRQTQGAIAGGLIGAGIGALVTAPETHHIDCRMVEDRIWVRYPYGHYESRYREVCR